MDNFKGQNHISELFDYINKPILTLKRIVRSIVNNTLMNNFYKRNVNIVLPRQRRSDTATVDATTAESELGSTHESETHETHETHSNHTETEEDGGKYIHADPEYTRFAIIATVSLSILFVILFLAFYFCNKDLVMKIGHKVLTFFKKTFKIVN